MESYNRLNFTRGRTRLRKAAMITATAAVGLTMVCSSALAEMPKSGSIIMFGQSKENPYFGQNAVGAEAIAKKFGWSFTYIESKSQEEQDNAISQMLATGQKPLGIILNPVSGAAAVASEAAIKQAGIPLGILNQVPSKEQAALFDVYGGVNDYNSGVDAAKLLAAGAKKAGVTLGDGLVVNTVAGHTAAQQRVEGFTAEMKKLFPANSKILANVNSGGFLEAEGYNIGSQIIPANLGKFNWVYGVNDALAFGAMRAAKENGIVPGKDVLFVGGTCMNPTTNKAVMDGELVGSSVQSPYIEGATAMYALAAFINTGKVINDEVYLSPDAPPSVDQPPHKWSFMPNPPLAGTTKAYEDTKIWGMTAQKLCNYS